MIFADLNTCRSLISRTPRYTTRRKALLDVLGDVGASILTCQECPTTIVADIRRHLGYSAVIHGKVVTFYMARKWKVGKVSKFNLPSPAAMPRRFLLTEFERIESGARIAIGNTHLTVHTRNDPKWRADQGNAIAGHVGKLTIPTIVAGDINETISTRVRAILGRAGMTAHLAGFGNADFDSHPGFKANPRNGKHLDEIFSKGVNVSGGRIVSNRRLGTYYSDHCLSRMDWTFDTPVPVV